MKFLAALFLLAFSAMAQDERPNILIALADNWAFPHASVYGDKTVKTPVFDTIAQNGFLFNEAYCQVPSCAPARAVLLTGQAFCRLGSGANLCGFWPEIQTYEELLKNTGYHTGYSEKGWAPGYVGRHVSKKINPAGIYYETFGEFIEKKPSDAPFCFWFGSHDPHMPWDKGTDFKANLKAETVKIPDYLPDAPIVRSQIIEYYAEIQKFDFEVGEIIELLKSKGLFENTILIIMGDNGWQAPRGLANLYDSGTKTCMAIQWPAKYNQAKTINSFVNFSDIAPTLLVAADIPVPKNMTGKSLWPVMDGKEKGETEVFLGRERHANVRYGDMGYPARGIRNSKFLYIRNYKPNLWPAGDPEIWFAVGPYGDVDNSPIKDFILAGKENETKRYFKICFDKRPSEELYDLKIDPDQTMNLAYDSGYKNVTLKMREALDAQMILLKDPRVKKTDTQEFDSEIYLGKGRR
jgi:N-sulfoglucosamine sulfohydrolase